jgi:threonine efflux protein
LAASGQRSTACAAALGITTVTLTWATLAILGIGIIFSAHPALRQAIQLAGGVYLGYLAVKLWRSQVAHENSQRLEIGKWAAFRLGFVTNVLNPKTALFFGSVFASALPANPSIFLVATAVALVYFNAVVWHLFLALAFSHPRIRLAYGHHRNNLNKISGMLIGAFGTRLLWATLQEFRGRGA